MVGTAVLLHTVIVATLFALTVAGVDSLAVLIAMLLASSACLGLVIPATMVLALDDHGPIAGMASALGGTLQMVAGGIVIAIVSRFFDGTALPMVAAIALCGVGALVLSAMTLGRRDLRVQAAE